MARLRGYLQWGPFGVALCATLLLWTVVDRWWFMLPLGYGPRWPWLVLVPLPLISGGKRWARVFACMATLALVAWGLLGWRISAPRFGAPDQQGLRVVTFNAALKPDALLATLEDGRNWGADLIAVVECPPRAGRRQDLQGYARADEGEICTWSRTPQAPLITMAPRDFSTIGWSGSIALVELPGTGMKPIGVLHLRSVRNELTEFLDLSAVLEQSDSMENRRSKRIAGSIYASEWFRTLAIVPELIMGDFNLVPESSRFRADWGEWTDAWESAGIGRGGTWHSNWYSLRIDRVIHSSAWRTRSVRVGEDVGSDHRPVFVELERR